MTFSKETHVRGVPAGPITGFICLAVICSFFNSSSVVAAPEAATTTAPAASVRKPGNPTTRPAAVEMIKLNFPENVEIKLLVEYVSRRLGMNIRLDPALGRKQITLIAPNSIPKDSLLDLLGGVLKSAGMVMVDTEPKGWKRIALAKDAMNEAPQFRDDPKTLGSVKSTATITQLFRFKHLTATKVQQMVKPFLSKAGGHCISVQDEKMLFISDFASNVRRIAALIEMMDKPGAKTAFKFVAVKNRDAADLVTQVTALLSQKRSVTAAAGQGQRVRSDLVLTTEPRTNQIIIIAAEGADTEALELIKTLDVTPQTETATYQLKHIPPQRIDKLARDMLTTDGVKQHYKSTIDNESGTLIVDASKPIHAKIAELVKQLDIAPDTQTVTYQFEHTSPRRIEKLVQDMLGTDEVRRFYKSTIDDESGLMIVTAPKSVHERLAALKKQLDVAGASAELGHVRFYKLLNTTASDVLATIQAIDSGGEGLSGLAVKELKTDKKGKFTGPNAPPSADPSKPVKPPAYSPDAGTALIRKPAVTSKYGAQTVKTRDASVTSDPNTNSIIVIAPPSVQRVYKELIKLLDKRRPQVMVEVTMVTLDTSEGFSLGVEISRSGQISGDPNHRYLTFNSFGLSEVADGTGRLTLTPGIGFNGTILSADVADVVLRALKTDGHTDVLSSPKLLVNDNATATLSSISEAPFTSINASDTVSTTSFAGYAQAGTTLTITPHISEGDHIQLQYSVTLNSFTGDGEGGVPPPRQTNTIDSEVSIPDGHTIIVGGLTRKDSSETASRIPYLGDIPWIGDYLFSSRTKSKSQSTLFVFIRPVVLRDDGFEDLKYLSAKDRKAAKMPSDFPTSGPLIMR